MICVYLTRNVASYRICAHVCLCVCGSRIKLKGMYVAQVHVCGTSVCVTLAYARVCVQDMTSVLVKMKFQEENGT